MDRHSLSKTSFILLLIFIWADSYSAPLFKTGQIRLKDKQYQLEIADTNRLRTHGLMFRKSMDKQAGMLFVYKNSGNYRIWMKNTLIPLSVFWLDEKAEIVDKKLLQPCKVKNCPISSAKRPSRYILELHPDQFDQFSMGDRLTGIVSWLEQSGL